MPITRSTGLPFDSERLSKRHIKVPRMISTGGYQRKGKVTTSVLYPAAISAARNPETRASAPPEVKGICVVQIRMLRIIMLVAGWIHTRRGFNFEVQHVASKNLVSASSHSHRGFSPVIWARLNQPTVLTVSFALREHFL